MVAKRLQGMAIATKIRGVAKQLKGNKNSKHKAQILDWLEDNEHIYEDLWEFTETGLVYNLHGDGEKTLPNFCTKLGLVSMYVKQALVQRQAIPISRALWKELKAKDPEIVGKLFECKYQLKKAYALKAGVSISSLQKFLDAATEAQGFPMKALKISGDAPSIGAGGKSISALSLSLPYSFYKMENNKHMRYEF